MKKAIKIIAVLFFLFIITLITIPFFFKKQIKETITQEVNKTIVANFSFQNVSINLLTNFPNAKITLDKIIITNKVPFEGDTLVFIENIEVKTSISNLLSKKLVLDNFSITNALVSLKTNEDNVSNYDIAKQSSSAAEDDTIDDTNSESTISLHIEEYSLNNINFNYHDQKSKLALKIENFNHRGTGVFSTKNIVLNTHSSIEKFTVGSENIHYLNQASITWKALLDINIETLKINFRENIAKLNDLHLSFDGFVQPLDEGILMDLHFDSKDSKFKSLLSLIPSAYSSEFENVKANGALNFSGNAEGLYSENEVPKFNVFINTKDASFQYPDLPKGIKHITIDTKIENKTGVLDDTEVVIQKFDFQIDKDKFNASSKLTHLISNPKVKASLNGVMNLGNLSQAYPLDLEDEIEGIITFNVNTAFTQKAIEEERFQEIKNSGSLSIQNMTVSTEMLPHPISIKNSYLKFTPKNFILEKFEATTASSDLSIKGTLSNLMGFVFGDKDLKGSFDVISKNINTFDLLSSEEIATEENVENPEEATTVTSAIKIPSKIDITANLKASKVSYDNINLENVKGVIRIKEQQAVFEKTTAEMLGGTIQLKGKVDTQPTPSTFDFDMSLKELDIVKSFETIDLFSSIAPFAKAINGKMSTSLDLTGLLDANFFPEMNSLYGKGDSQLEVKDIDPKKSNAMSLLNDNFNLIDFNKLDMKKIQAAMKFENSKVIFSPFNIATYDGTKIEMSGSHSFENKMSYNLTTALPVDLLGKEATALLSGLSEEETKNMTVPMTIRIGGSVTSPKVTPDYKSAITALSSKVIESQKNKLLNSLFKENKKEGDTTKSKRNDLEKAASKLLKSLFN